VKDILKFRQYLASRVWTSVPGNLFLDHSIKHVRNSFNGTGNYGFWLPTVSLQNFNKYECNYTVICRNYHYNRAFALSWIILSLLTDRHWRLISHIWQSEIGNRGLLSSPRESIECKDAALHNSMSILAVSVCILRICAMAALWYISK